MSKIIAISGVATAGKDTAKDLIIEQLGQNNCFCSSFARQLRLELKDFILEKLNIDVFTQNKEEKDLIRPLLVHYAAVKRKQTKGQYFVDFINKEYKNCNKPYFILTDLRFGFYFDKITQKGDEIGWVKENNGVILHISRYLPDPYAFILPANEEERLNNPIIKDNADYKIKWPTTEKTELKKYIKEFINELKLK